MQWRKAAEVFEKMHGQGCTPDVVTYTALISAYEKGGQWRRALGAFDQMRVQGCKADAIVYNAIIDASWETGVVWAQRRVCYAPAAFVAPVLACACACALVAALMCFLVLGMACMCA